MYDFVIPQPEEPQIDYVRIFEEALGNMTPEFFKIKVAYQRKGIVRERLFCYELYHQVRLILQHFDNLGVVLHGEIDKRGHRNFEIAHRKNPDFIFHSPGNFENNAAVIEIKGKFDSDGIRKDIATLFTFVGLYRYSLGVFILYNYDMVYFVRKMETYLFDNYGTNPNQSKILVLCIKNAYEDIEICCLQNIIAAVVERRN